MASPWTFALLLSLAAPLGAQAGETRDKPPYLGRQLPEIRVGDGTWLNADQSFRVTTRRGPTLLCYTVLY